MASQIFVNYFLRSKLAKKNTSSVPGKKFCKTAEFYTAKNKFFLTKKCTIKLKCKRSNDLY